MNPAATRGLKKAGRTLIQMAGAGSLTAAFTVLAHGLSPEQQATMMVFWGVVVTFVHNYLETKGVIPTLLPTAGLVTTTTGGLLGKALGTVDTAVNETGTVAGTVISTAGEAVGGVTGLATALLDGQNEEAPK